MSDEAPTNPEFGGGSPSGGVRGVIARVTGGRAKVPLDSKALHDVNEELINVKKNIDAIKKAIGELKTAAPNGVEGILGLGGKGGNGSYSKTIPQILSGGPKAGDDGTPDSPVSKNLAQGSSTNYQLDAANSGANGTGGGSGSGGGGGSGGGWSPPGGGRYSSPSSYINYVGISAARSGYQAYQAARAAGNSSAYSAGSAAGALGPLGMAAVGAFAGQTVANMSSNLFAPLNERIDRGYAYSLSADKMAVLYQQMTGMSQLGVSSAYRKPLTQYRIGATGINDLMQMQSQTGLSALNQAGASEAIQTMSGYSISSPDATNMISSLADPTVVNQMYMMTGQALIGPGGVENSAFSVIQNMSKYVNISNEQSGRVALRPGSMTRARLAAMGLSPEMQTQVIQYAMENFQYKKKGGNGNYDPTKESDRRRMGIEENFATQQQETTRQGVEREENFYRRQVDNFADLERMTQTLTRTMGELEDAMQAIIGLKISTRPAGKALGSGLKTLGTGATALGLGMSAAGMPEFGIPIAIAGFAASGISGLIGGDGPLTTSGASGGAANTEGRQYASTRGSNSSSFDPNAPVADWGTLGKLMSNATFNKLHPEVQKRTAQVLIEGKGQIGISSGWRSTEAQATMFFQRYKKTNRTDKSRRLNKSDRYYQGYWYEKQFGFDANPPGQSLHEFGLAVDFSGNIELANRLAKKYGFNTFENVNGEPHHAQPVEIPKGFAEWEAAGRPWSNGQGGGSYDAPSVGDSTSGITGADGLIRPSSRMVSTFSNGTSLSDMILGTANSSSGAGWFSPGTTSDGQGSVSSSSGMDVGEQTSTNIAAGQLNAEQIVQVFKAAGFQGEDLTKSVAISWRESRWNSMAHNPKPPDNSYGLMQINMIDSPEKNYYLGRSRREQYGIVNEDLFKPDVNARVARSLVGDGGGWSHWRPGDGKGGSYPETHGTDMAWAARVVSAVNSGKPAPEKGGDGPVTMNNSMVSASSLGRSSRPEYVGHSPEAATAAASRSVSAAVTTNTSNFNVTISPSIHIAGGAGRRETERVAKEIGALLEREVKYTLMRES